MEQRADYVVKKVLSAYTDATFEQLSEGMMLWADLHLRPSEMDAVIFEIEDYLQCDFPPERSGLNTVADLIAAAEAALSERKCN